MHGSNFSAALISWYWVLIVTWVNPPSSHCSRNPSFKQACWKNNYPISRFRVSEYKKSCPGRDLWSQQSKTSSYFLLPKSTQNPFTTRRKHSQKEREYIAGGFFYLKQQNKKTENNKIINNIMADNQLIIGKRPKIICKIWSARVSVLSCT